MSNPLSDQRLLRAYAKLTLSLAVTGRRDDGYHLIRSEMVSIDLADEMEVTSSEESSIEVIDEIDWSTGGLRPRLVVPDGPENLVMKACRLAGYKARVKLRKRIPTGAGLGGGSADAGALLAECGWRDLEAAARLGADVPFCIVPGRALVEGIGEQLTYLAGEERTFIVLTPALFVSTALVYRAYDELANAGRDSAREKTASLARGGLDPLVNDLEPAALVVEPRLQFWRDMLAEVTASRPSLAGSGASFFAAVDPARSEELRDELRSAVLHSKQAAVVTLAQTVTRRDP